MSAVFETDSTIVPPLGYTAPDMVSLLRQRAQEQPDKLAYTFLLDGEDQAVRWTYAQVDRRARAIAARLQQLAPPGQRALLVYDPGLDYLAALAGCFYAGVIAVPAYPPDPMRIQRLLPRLQAIVTDSQARLLLSTNEILSWSSQFFAKLTGVESIVTTDDVADSLADRWHMPAVDRSTLALLQYTSGSTGMPKGVMISHGNLLHNLGQIHEVLHREGNMVSSWLPAYHDMGLMALLIVWHSGLGSVMMPPLAFFQRPIRWLKTFAEHGANISAAPNFAYDLCVRKTTPQERAGLDLSNWTITLNGAEPIRADTLERFLEAFGPCGVRRQIFHPGYGLAEATVLVTMTPQYRGPIVGTYDAQALEQNLALHVREQSESGRQVVGCGRAAPGVRVVIADPQSRHLLPDGQVGEVWVQGPNVGQGYWGRPEESQCTFRATTADGQGPFLRTGDLGFLERGELYVTGRLKDLIIVWGGNHYPQDIERTVEECHPALKPYGGAVFSVDVNGQERVVVVHEVRKARVDFDALLKQIRQSIAEAHTIAVDAIVLIKSGAIPKTSSGKTQRAECRRMYLAGELQAVAEWKAGAQVIHPDEYVAPRTPTEELLAQAWSEVLGVPRVGVYDNFFDLGGHSLLATQLISRLAPSFPVEVSLKSLFDCPTVAALAELLDQAMAGRATGGSSLAEKLARLESMSDAEARQMMTNPSSSMKNGSHSAAPAAAMSAAPASAPAAGPLPPRSNATPEVHEFLIMGAGPAGLQMAYFLEKAGCDYLILEGGDAPGTFFRTFPRHRMLISINKVYTGYDDTEVNLRWDWNSLLCDEPKLLFKNYSREYFPDADVMVRYLADFAAHYRLKVKYNSRVVRVTRDNGFVVQDQDGRVYRGKVLIVATGCPEANIPKVPGIELAESYNSMSIDPEDFAGQRVLILGKGNSAFETANHLVGTTALIHLASPHPVKMAWKTHHVGHLRAVNNDLLDTYMLKSQNALLDGEIESLRRDGDKIIARVRYAHAADEVEELTYDRVLCCTGFRCDVSMFDETCPPEMAIMGRFPAQNSNWESTNIPDLYFAGTLMQTRDFKKKQSGFIHGFRYNVQTLFHMLREKYHGVAFPSTRVEATPEALTDYFLHRANKNSSLWQQTGFLCDVALATPQEIRYFEDLPVDYVHDRLGQQDGDYYTMTLEFGQERIDACHDVFAIERVHKDDCHRAEMSTGIHPIIRRYRRGQKISEHHVLEDLASEWKEDVHVLPLIEYFRQQLGRGSPQLVGCPS